MIPHSAISAATRDGAFVRSFSAALTMAKTANVQLIRLFRR